MNLEVVATGEFDRLPIDDSRLVSVTAEMKRDERTAPEVEEKRGGSLRVWWIDAIDERVSPAEVSEVLGADLAFVEHLLETLASLLWIETERWFPDRQWFAWQRRCCLDKSCRLFPGDRTRALQMQIVTHKQERTLPRYFRRKACDPKELAQ